MNVNLHFHTLVLDGVFTEEPRGGLAFHPAPAPTDAEVAAALATIRYRVQRLLVAAAWSRPTTRRARRNIPMHVMAGTPCVSASGMTRPICGSPFSGIVRAA